MNESSSWLNRITDTYVDFELTSLILVLVAIGLGTLVHIAYFRGKLEQRVTNGISPRQVKLEALALALAVGAFIAGFSGWGFLWIAGVLVVALIVAFMSGERKLIGLILVILILAILITVMGWKLNAL